MRSLHTAVKRAHTIVPIVGNNTTEGTGTVVDVQGCDQVEALVSVGDSGDTLSGSVYLQPTLQHGDLADGSDMADVPVANLIRDAGTAAGEIHTVIDAPGEDQVLIKAGYTGLKRYVRVKIVFTGTHTNGIPISAVIETSQRRYAGKTQFGS